MHSIGLVLAKRLGQEFVGWLGLVFGFLALYIFHFDAPVTAAFPHLVFVGLLIVALSVIRYSLFKWAPFLVAQWIAAGITTTLFLALSGYYAITLIGLESWGRVISWGLIVTYVLQFPALLDTLGLPLWLAGIALILIVLGNIFAIAILQKRYDWIPLITGLGSHRGIAIIYIVTCTILGIELWSFFRFPPIETGEPISLTLHPGSGKKRLQSHTLDLARQLELQEESIRRNYQTTLNAHKRNVIVIVVDALRSDHLPLFGYRRVTTANLERLDKAGMLLGNSGMYSACSESSCGLMALASSRYVHQFTHKPITLQEILHRHGYRTHMILSGDHTNFYGLRESYGPLDSFFDGSMAQGYYMNDDQLILDQLSRFPEWNGNPVFMQFHIMSTHGIGKRYPNYSPFQPSRSYYVDMGKHMLSNDWVPDERYTNFYDNGVVHTDAIIEQIFSLLKHKGYLEDSVAVITADHGEMLGEHGRFSHARSLYEPVLRIPFVMIRFGYSSMDKIPKDLPVSQVDIAPTILAELGIAAPESWSGLALQDIAAGRKNRQFIYFQQGAEYGLLDIRPSYGGWKFWVDARTGSEHVFDLNTDSAELIDRRPDVTLSLWSEWMKNLIDLQVVAHANAEK